MNHQCSCLVSILEAVRARCFGLEASLGFSRSARLVQYMARGEADEVGRVLRAWVWGVVKEYSCDPDVLRVVGILLDIFIAEARELKTSEYGVLRAFCLRWVNRCILRLGVGVVVGELVFVA